MGRAAVMGKCIPLLPLPKWMSRQHGLKPATGQRSHPGSNVRTMATDRTVGQHTGCPTKALISAHLFAVIRTVGFRQHVIGVQCGADNAASTRQADSDAVAHMPAFGRDDLIGMGTIGIVQP